MNAVIKTLFALFVCITMNPDSGRAQTTVVAADKMNVVYIGIVNPITIVVENLACDDLIATAEFGDLRKVSGCAYTMTVSRQGQFDITIRRKDNNKVIGKQAVRSKYIGLPIAIVGKTKSGSKFPVNQFKAQQGISVIIENVEFDLRFMVTDFEVRVKRLGKIIFEKENRGNHFDSACKSFFQTLQSGDEVEFFDIRATGPDNLIRMMNQIHYTII